MQFTMEYYSRIYYSMLWYTLPWYGTTVYHGIVPGYTVVLLQMYLCDIVCELAQVMLSDVFVYSCVIL